MSELPRVTIAVPTLNEERHIEACLEGILEQTYPRDRLEVLVLDGGSQDRTRDVAAAVAEASDATIRLIPNDEGTIPAALNLAIAAATGEHLVRVDAHSIPAANYVQACVEGNLEHEADLSGGWRKTQGDGVVSRAVGRALASRFAMASAEAWNPTERARRVVSVPCGAYRIETLRRLGGFDEGQHANEDYELNYRLNLAGGRVMLIPGTDSVYVPRGSFGSLARQFGRYGFYKARMMVKHPKSVRPRHLAPAGGLLGVAALALAAPFSRSARVGLGLGGLGYTGALATASVRSGRGMGRAGWLMAPVFVTMHAAWGAGNLAGLIRWFPRRRELR